MNDQATIRRVPSALSQAGVDNTVFRSETLRIEERPGTALIRLHSIGDLHDSASTLIDLPGETGTCSGENPTVLCLRPREWLLVSETVSASELVHHVQAKIDPQRASILNVSDGLALFRLAGEGAPWLLNKLSGLDFQAGRAAGPHCARTKMGHIAVLVHYHSIEGGEFVFDLFPDRSYAKYLWDLLRASAPHADELALAFGDAA